MNSDLPGAMRAALAGLAMVAMLVPTATQAEDSSIKRKLAAIGQTYQIDQDGDYKLSFQFTDEKRSQIVFVSGAAEDVSPIFVRQVFAPIAYVDKDGIAAKALDLLRQNFTLKIGGFEVDGNYLIYNIKLSDSASPQELQRAISLVASVADDKEKELSGSRDTF